MSEIRLIVRDAQREIHATRHGSFADAVLAALSADPETIEELDTALERFQRPGEWSFFRGFHPGANDEPYDAGLGIIDLAARLVAWDSTYSAPGMTGAVSYHNGQCDTDVMVRYRLADDWQITSNVEVWRSLAERRRRERAENPPLNARAVLFGRPLLEFLATECRASNEPVAGDRVRDIHKRWLLTPREDLRGQSPRDVMLARHALISWDLQYRSEQWSELGECPRGLDPDSRAFRYTGFGTHELVMYYNLIRFLLEGCWNEFLNAEIPELELFRDAWLYVPEPDCHGLIPREIIDHERARLPEGMTGRDAVIDHNCPMCEMMADMPGPMFWNLDGSSLDDDFAFSFHRTRAEWDAEQREHEEFNRRFEAEREERERLGVKYPEGNSPWQRSFVAPDSEGLPLTMQLYGIGSLLAELIEDLKEPAEDRPLIDRLNRDFGNLREVIQTADVELAEALLEPVVDRFGETLEAVASARPNLQPKCADLEKRLRRFLEPPSESGSSFDSNDDGLPF